MSLFVPGLVLSLAGAVSPQEMRHSWSFRHSHQCDVTSEILSGFNGKCAVTYTSDIQGVLTVNKADFLLLGGQEQLTSH